MNESKCEFNLAWRDQCDQDPVSEGYCLNHKDIMCVSCGEKAFRECSQTSSQFVCGHPLCGNCEHTIHSNGCNSGGSLPYGMGGHVKKEDQAYKMWMEPDAENYNEDLKKAYQGLPHPEDHDNQVIGIAIVQKTGLLVDKNLKDELVRTVFYFEKHAKYGWKLKGAE